MKHITLALTGSPGEFAFEWGLCIKQLLFLF